MSPQSKQHLSAADAATAITPDGGASSLEPAITVERLSKRFGGHIAVDDLSFAIPHGIVTGFLGPNGSGKTTTIRMILGLIRPTAGNATVDGRPFAELADPGRHVGIVIDGAAAHPRRTARNHVRILAAERRVAADRVEQVLAAVGLTDDANRKVGEFSLGMRQRLELAAALLGQPRVLILDEPGNGLDPAGIRWLRDFLRSFATAGGTVFVSSHQLAEITLLADEVVVISRGRLVTHTRVGDLTARHVVKVRTPQADVVRQAVVDAGGDVRVLDSTTLEVIDLAAEDVGAIAARAGAVLHELTPQLTTLEDVFLELTTAEGEAR